MARREPTAPPAGNAGVGNDESVHAKIRRLRQQLTQGRQVRLLRVNVHREVNFNIVGVSKSHRLGQLRRAKVLSLSPQAKITGPQIDGVRAVKHGHLQLFQIAGRGQQFRFIC